MQFRQVTALRMNHCQKGDHWVWSKNMDGGVCKECLFDDSPLISPDELTKDDVTDWENSI